MKHYINTTNQIFGFDDDQLHLVTSDMTELSDVALAALLAPTPEQLLSQFKAEVQAALDSTDMIAFRCFKAGVAYPTEWLAYTTALRGLLGATEVGVLPTKPAFPAGT